jgi:ribosomal protein L14
MLSQTGSLRLDRLSVPAIRPHRSEVVVVLFRRTAVGTRRKRDSSVQFDRKTTVVVRGGESTAGPYLATARGCCKRWPFYRRWFGAVGMRNAVIRLAAAG